MEDEFIKCVWCKSLIHENDAIEHDSDYYCEDCYDEIFTKCYNCNKIINRDDTKEYDGNDWCESCFEETFTECYSCGKVTNKEDLYLGNDDNLYCEPCWEDKFFKCYDCNETILNNHVYIGPDDRDYCEYCFDEIFGHCADCDEVYNRDDLYFNDENDCYYCESCNDEHQEGNIDGMHSYNYKPISIYHGIDKRFYRKIPKHMTISQAMVIKNNKQLFLGVELETEYAGDNHLNDLCPELLEKFSDSERLFYLKYDSSISNGFEIVTHPMTLDYHKNKLDWDGILQWLRDNHFLSYKTTTCGLHIHASKQFLSEREQRRLGVFISLNQPKIEIVARRKDNGYGKYKKIQKNGKTVCRLIDANKNECGRDDAVNWSNLRTYEFRLFKGSLVYDTMIASLEFVESVSKFVKTTPIRKIVDDKSWSQYIEFLMGFNGDYGMLMKYMEHRQTRKKNIGIELVKMQTELNL